MPELEYFPQKRYIDENLKGETSLKESDFFALAAAQRRAVEQGVLKPELAKQLIPMAMVEGWRSNYGVRQNLMLYASPQNIERFKKMGLSIAEEHEILSLANGTSFSKGTVEQPRVPSFIENVKGKLQRGMMEMLDHVEQSSREPGKELTPAQKEWDKLVELHRADAHPDKIDEQTTRFEQIRDGILDAKARMPAPDDELNPDMVIVERKGEKYLTLGMEANVPNGSTDDNDIARVARWNTNRAARIMAAVLSEKASHKDVASVDDAVKSYNGRGKSTEYMYDQPIPADTEVYLSKVKEAGELLGHPKNAPLSDYLDKVGAMR